MTGPADVATTLDDLERKLKDLERELAAAADPAGTPAALSVVAPLTDPRPPVVDAPPAPPAPPVAVPAPAPAPPVAEPRDVLVPAAAPVAPPPAPAVLVPAEPLQRFREQLALAAGELLGAFDALVGALPDEAPVPHVWNVPVPPPAPPVDAHPAPAAAPPPAPVTAPLPPAAWAPSPSPSPAPPPPADPGPLPAPAAPSAFLPLPDAPVLPPAPDPEPPAPAEVDFHAPVLPGIPLGAPPTPVTSVLTKDPDAPTPAGPGPNDQLTFGGQVTVDAGPFADIATLSSFEQALGQIPGTQDVYVRGFEGSRALIDLVLGQPVAVGDELRRTAPLGFTITAATSDHLSITIDGGRHA